MKLDKAIDDVQDAGASTPGTRVAESPRLVEMVRRKSAELLGRSEMSGMLLLRDLRNLYLTAQEAEIVWVILGQCAQAVRDQELLDVANQGVVAADPRHRLSSDTWCGTRAAGMRARMLHKHAAEGIHRIDEASTNWFLVEDGDRVTVVDTGFPRSWGTLQRALHSLGRSPGDIDAVVLTHAHFDHMGFAERARSELGAPVWAHEREVPMTQHPWRYDHERSRLRYARYPEFLKIFAAMGARGALWVKGTERVRTFVADEQLDVPGRPHVVFTPGHTHGHCSLHFRDRGAVIAGDALVTLDPYTGSRGPQIVSGAATADSGRALASLDALAALDATTMLVGHGEPWTQDLRLAVERAKSAAPS